MAAHLFEPDPSFSHLCKDKRETRFFEEEKKKLHFLDIGSPEYREEILFWTLF